jgi:tetratricopeptide (TPR) repeat protein
VTPPDGEPEEGGQTAEEAVPESTLLVLREGLPPVTETDAGLAEAAAARAVSQFATLPDHIREADALRVAALAAIALGKHDAAATALERALSLARSYGSSLIEAEVLFVRAALARGLSNEEAAHASAEAAVAIYERLGATAARDSVLAWLARVGDGRR